MEIFIGIGLAFAYLGIGVVSALLTFERLRRQPDATETIDAVLAMLTGLVWPAVLVLNLTRILLSNIFKWPVAGFIKLHTWVERRAAEMEAKKHADPD